MRAFVARGAGDTLQQLKFTSLHFRGISFGWISVKFGVTTESSRNSFTLCTFHFSKPFPSNDLQSRNDLEFGATIESSRQVFYIMHLPFL
mmetsp:Transcript_30135/g.42005  ORF Transcript_30135/g.42005 Transcript_30135/m.42005 type:complete len:90 (+) Transcript_30135:216-485(+)